MSPESRVQSPKSAQGSRLEGRGAPDPEGGSRFTFHDSRFTREGSVLFTTLFLVGILGLTLASYLLWVGTQNVLVTESHAWNAALANAEAGIEEGMAQVNVFYGNVLNVTNYYLSAQTNWGQAAGVFGPRTNTLISGSYSATIQPNSPGPTITSVGYTTVPYTSVPIQRTVQVTTRVLPSFGYAVTVTNGITLKGNNVTIDSFDSTDPAHNTNGLYDAATRMAGADIASFTGLVDIQGANLYGHLHLGTNATYSVGNGTVGDLNWTGPGIEPGWLTTDFNQTFADVKAPDTTGWFTSPTTTNPGNQTNTYVFTSGSYYLNSNSGFTINNNETMTVSGNVILYVIGNFTMKSQNGSYINILPGGSLTLYVGTASTSTPVTTQLTQVNTSGNAMTFQYFGLPSNNSLTWSGNSTFIGAVYAPEAVFSCGGGGNNNYDFQGACVVGSVAMNGHFNFHFDENLKRNGPVSGFTVSSWREMY